MTSRHSRRSVLKRGAGLAAGAALLPGLGVHSASAQPGADKTLTIAYPANLEAVDPHSFHSPVATGSVLACAMETLLDRDPETMAIRPLLATAYRNIDPLTWEFELRRGVKFHNGENFDAEAVKFSLERAIYSKMSTAGKTMWSPSFGQSVEIVDSHKVLIKTKVPDPLVPNRLTVESFSIAPPKAMAEFQDKVFPRLIGTGPYKFIEYVVGRHATFEVNEAYWGAKPASSKIVWTIITDASTRAAALQRGSVDVVVSLPNSLLSTVERGKDTVVYSTLGSVVHGVLLNTTDPTAAAALKDKRVRQALNHAIDREAIIKSLFGGRGKAVNGVVAHQVEYSADPGAYAYSPEKAKALLAEAGFASGFELSLWQATQRWENAVEYAQAVADYLDRVGVRAKLQTLEFGDYNVRAGGTRLKDAFFYGFINMHWDPGYLLPRFLKTFPTFRYFEAPPGLAEKLTRYDSIFDREERRRVAADCQREIHEEAPWLFLWQVNENFGLKRSVKGFKMRPDQMLYVRDAYVES